MRVGGGPGARSVLSDGVPMGKKKDKYAHLAQHVRHNGKSTTPSEKRSLIVQEGPNVWYVSAAKVFRDRLRRALDDDQEKTQTNA